MFKAWMGGSVAAHGEIFYGTRITPFRRDSSPITKAGSHGRQPRRTRFCRKARQASVIRAADSRAPLLVSPGLTVPRFAFAPCFDGSLRPRAAASWQEPFGCARDRIQPCMLASASIGPRWRPVPGVLPCNVIWTNGERFSGFNPRLPNLMSSPRLQFALRFNRGSSTDHHCWPTAAFDRIADERRSATTRHKRPH
jgi:hypothetical protein